MRLDRKAVNYWAVLTKRKIGYIQIFISAMLVGEPILLTPVWQRTGVFILWLHRGACMLKVTILIDGGYLRKVASPTYRYNPDFIEKVVWSILREDERLFRTFYYDCDPYTGKVSLPVSGQKRTFDNPGWLNILAAKDFFAVRRGVLKFRGFKPKKIPVKSESLSDDDFYPDFEQKGVDMRIGLDIATFSVSKAVDRVILVSGDTDCVPAMKHGRIAGLQIVITHFPGQNLSRELMWHADECRAVEWPADAEKFQR